MPRKTSGDAPVAKATKARTAKTSTVAKPPAVPKKAAKSTATKTAATTAAQKKKLAAQSAEEASTAKANISKKRQREVDDDDEEEESEEDLHPKAKRTKVTAVAPKVTKSKPVSKAKVASSKTSSSKTAPSKKIVTATKKTTGIKSTARSADAAPVPEKTSVKRQADEPVDGAAVPKKAQTAASTKDDESRDEESSGKSEDDAPVAKRAKVTATKKAAPPKKTVDHSMRVKIGAQMNVAPTTPLDIFVFGEGSAGELGLGAKVVDKKSPIDVKRPRKNLLLSGPEVGVVQLACGGMHGLALTKDNKILSWGVNDQGALGRSTKWEGGLRDVDASESDEEEEDDDTGLNPRESTPAEVDTSGIAPGTKFVRVAACDSASFALTEDGRVYGWGTFRVSSFSCMIHLLHV